MTKRGSTAEWEHKFSKKLVNYSNGNSSKTVIVQILIIVGRSKSRLKPRTGKRKTIEQVKKINVKFTAETIIFVIFQTNGIHIGHDRSFQKDDVKLLTCKCGENLFP